MTLIGEWADAVAGLTPADRRVLLHHGLRGAEFGEAIGAADILVDRDLYQPDVFGDRAFIIRVLDWGGGSDLLAFHPATPDAWALREGNATMLGRIEPFLPDAPTRVWRTPLAWLRGGCRGICILTRDPSERQDILLRCRGIAAEDIDHAIDLRRLAERPLRTPEIIVGGQHDEGRGTASRR